MRKAKKRLAASPPQRLELGQYIVADPAICHGRVTFKGTRVFVADVLADVASGRSWDFIIHRWGGGKITKAAIAEAVQLSQDAWLSQDGRLARHSTELSLPKVA
jgi:uncharacterized protein (DUF433 family)